MQSSRREQARLSRALRNLRHCLQGGNDLTGRHQAGSFVKALFELDHAGLHVAGADH